MKTQLLLYLVPIFFFVHNLEEVFGVKNHRKKLFSFQPEVHPIQFVIAVGLLTALVFVGSVWGANHPNSEYGFVVVIIFQAIIFINSLIPHAVVWVRFRSYNPGLLTAVFVNIPFSVILFHRVVTEEIITFEKLLGILAIAPVVMILLIKGALTVAEIIISQSR
jgi:hypothetical protein